MKAIKRIKKKGNKLLQVKDKNRNDTNYCKLKVNNKNFMNIRI